jgi:hypothetical protein
MPKKISGAKRKERNEFRASEAVAGHTEGILFGRVVKLLGNGQVHVIIDTKRIGPKTLLVRLPRTLGKRGSTPLSTTSIVSIFVGKEFDPDKDLSSSDKVVTNFLFDITSIIDEKSIQILVKDRIIPEWMIKSGSTDTKEIKIDEGFVFGDESDEEESKESKEEAAKEAPKEEEGDLFDFGDARVVATPRGMSGRDKANPCSSRLIHIED